MSYEFKLFTDAGGSYIDRISIRTTGQIGLSQGFIIKQKLIESQKYAQLYYDEKQKTMGVKIIDDKNLSGAVKIHARKTLNKDNRQSLTAHIAAKAFLDFNKIDYKTKTKSYNPEWSAEYEMFLVDLKKESGN